MSRKTQTQTMMELCEAFRNRNHCCSPGDTGLKQPEGVTTQTSFSKIQETSDIFCYRDTSLLTNEETPTISCTALSTKCEEAPVTANSSSQSVTGEQKETYCCASKAPKKNTLCLPAINERRIRELSCSLVQDQFPFREKQVEVHCCKITQSLVKHPEGQQKERRRGVAVAKPVLTSRKNDIVQSSRKRSPAVQTEGEILRPSLVRRTRVTVMVSKRQGDEPAMERSTKISHRKNTLGGCHEPRSVSEKPGKIKNKQSVKRNQITKRQQKVTGDQMQPIDRRVAPVVQVVHLRRVARQNVTGDVQVTDRRDGLCAQTSPDQQQLMFMRVLRKRF